jgi:Killing trait
MADPTLVNGQVTDAVTQTNVKILGEAPGQALGTLYQVMAQSVGISMQNAVAAQQQMNLLGQAATTQGINLLYSMDPATATVSTQDILSGNSLGQLIAELNAVLASAKSFARQS